MSYKLVFDFTCRIEGQEDRIHMVQQRHNEGYGLVIRSEKDDIWERLSGSEAFRLEEKLLDEVEYRTYHNRIEKLDSLSACREMHFELMENNNPNLNYMIGKIWNELGQKENILSTKVIAENANWISVCLASHPNAELTVTVKIVMQTAYIMVRIVKHASSFTAARRRLPCRVQRRIWSDSVWYSTENMGAVITTPTTAIKNTIIPKYSMAFVSVPG